MFQVAFTHSEKVGMQETKQAAAAATVNGNSVGGKTTEEDDDINLDDI